MQFPVLLAQAMAKSKLKKAAALADKLGLTRGEVSNWLHDRRAPEPDMIPAIMDALELPDAERAGFKEAAQRARMKRKADIGKQALGIIEALKAELRAANDELVGLRAEFFALQAKNRDLAAENRRLAAKLRQSGK